VKALGNLADQYAKVLARWQKEKAKDWTAELPKGAVPASEWVEKLTKVIANLKSAGRSADDAFFHVPLADETLSHHVVPADDPRSHLYGADSRAYPDDYAILKQHYPAWAEGKKPEAVKSEGGLWKGASAGTDAGRLQTEVEKRAQALGLDRYPHLVIPMRPAQRGAGVPATFGRSKFGPAAEKPEFRYAATVLSPHERSIENESMASLSGVEPDRLAYDVIDDMGGGAYEHNGKVIYANSVESRTLLHEVGHYKQDLEGFSEKTVNSKLLEYHNIVTVEQDHEKDKPVKERWIRLSYSGNPKVFKQAQWAEKLPDYADPRGYALLKKLATPREQKALREIEQKLDREPETYTRLMRRYLESELAREYFAASKFKNF
jgi:hypothetical protein